MPTYTRRVRVLYEVLIDLKSATSTTIIPQITGKKFLPRAAYAIVETKTGSGTGPSLTITQVGASFPIIGTPSAIPGTYAPGEECDFTLTGTSRIQRADMGVAAIVVTVTGASTYTTHTATIVIEGYEVG